MDALVVLGYLIIPAAAGSIDAIKILLIFSIPIFLSYSFNKKSLAGAFFVITIAALIYHTYYRIMSGDIEPNSIFIVSYVIGEIPPLIMFLYLMGKAKKNIHKSIESRD